MWPCSKLIAVSIVGVAAFFYLVVHHSPLSGTLPIFHFGIPWGYTEDEVPDLQGKVAVVTGANVGLGRGTAQLLAKHGAHVYITCRSQHKCDQAVKDIEAVIPKGGSGRVECSILELGSLASIRRWLQAAADRFKLAQGIDILILNAGVMASPYQLSEDGIEWQFAVNHVGHFMLANGIIDFVKAAASRTGEARVVVVSSLAYLNTPSEGVRLTLDGVNHKAEYDPWAWYGQSKLANILFANELQRKLNTTDPGVFVNSLHPGGVHGDLLKHAMDRTTKLLGRTVASWMETFTLSLYWTEQQGALTVLYPATSPHVVQHGIKGHYFVPIARDQTPFQIARNESLAQGLWTFTEDLLAQRGI